MPSAHMQRVVDVNKDTEIHQALRAASAHAGSRAASERSFSSLSSAAQHAQSIARCTPMHNMTQCDAQDAEVSRQVARSKKNQACRSTPFDARQRQMDLSGTWTSTHVLQGGAGSSMRSSTAAPKQRAARAREIVASAATLLALTSSRRRAVFAAVSHARRRLSRAAHR